MQSAIPNPITLEDIREAAVRLSNAHNDTAATAALMQAEVKAAIAPILARYKATIDTYAAAQAKAHNALDCLLMAAPHLFVRPRSLSVDGVRCGYKKAEDSIEWKDEAAVIAAIRSIDAALAPLLIRSQESLIVDALAGVGEKERAAFGVRTVTGVDQRFITVGDNDAEKLTKVIIADASRRQGEEEPAKKAKKGAKA